MSQFTKSTTLVIETLMEEVNPMVNEEHESEYRNNLYFEAILPIFHYEDCKRNKKIVYFSIEQSFSCKRTAIEP